VLPCPPSLARPLPPVPRFRSLFFCFRVCSGRFFFSICFICRPFFFFAARYRPNCCPGLIAPWNPPFKLGCTVQRVSQQKPFRPFRLMAFVMNPPRWFAMSRYLAIHLPHCFSGPCKARFNPVGGPFSRLKTWATPPHTFGVGSAFPAPSDQNLHNSPAPPLHILLPKILPGPPANPFNFPCSVREWRTRDVFPFTSPVDRAPQL